MVQGSGRTLYAVDLDGTLLDDRAQLTEISRRILAELLDEGLLQTVASARSVVAIRMLLAGVLLRLPVIEFNGAFLPDPASGTQLSTQGLSASAAGEIYELVGAAGHMPFLSTFDGERDRLSAPPRANAGTEWYIDDRRAQTGTSTRPCWTRPGSRGSSSCPSSTAWTTRTTTW